MKQVFDAYTYQYLFGTLIFLVGVGYAAKQGYVSWKGKGLRNLCLMFGGLFFFAALQGYMQYAPMKEAAPGTFQGEWVRKKTIGTNLDYAIMVLYFAAILGIGTYFGRRQKTVKDFFFGGQRFSWWLITFSLIATTVGSYSFVKYSNKAFKFGLSSSQTYLNDWFYVPLFVFGWLPLLYFTRVTSVPEYFERRFGRSVRVWVSIYILIYLVGYVGINLFTMGKVLNALLGWDILFAAFVVAVISAIYVTAGGQTSVIMTDLFQGVMLLATGIIILLLGAWYLGGFDALWCHLPRGHRWAFANFNSDASFPGVGIFWQDGVANTGMFWFLHQGAMMRYMSARSVKEARKAAIVVPWVLMPIAACVVASGGWVARSLVHAGVLPQTVEPQEAFFIATEFLSRPGLFGLILAALTAALMSTVDTLITAVSAITVNDFYKPFFRPKAGEKELLRTARVSSVGATLTGIVLVPIFMTFESIYDAHGAFTAAVTPPLVVTLLFSVFWRRFTRKAALWTLVGGMVAILASLFYPQLIAPFAHGIPMADRGDGFLGGMNQFKYMRSLYGLIVSAGFGVLVTFLTRAEPKERQQGLVWGTVMEAIKRYKGSAGKEEEGRFVLAAARSKEDEEFSEGTGSLPVVDLSSTLAKEIDAKVGDLLYVSDRRGWLGGLLSTHAVVGELLQEESSLVILMGPTAYGRVVSPKRTQEAVKLQKLY